MANTRTGNVIYVDTTAAFAAATIRAVKYIGNASGTATITNDSKNIWNAGGTPDLAVDEICARCDSGFTVTVTNSAKAYIYLEE